MSSDFNDPKLGKTLVRQIEHAAQAAGPVNIMEVCGTHTMAIGKFGIRRLLPETVNLISGPGCPVCVTPGQYIDNAVTAAKEHNLTIATFGDMIRVPGNMTSLERARAEGVTVRVLTSPLDIFSMEGEILFLAVGFETTAAPIAAAIRTAAKKENSSVSFYTSLKVIPPTLNLLGQDPDIQVNAFLLPGHVSAVIGSDAYSGLGVPAWITGFDMLDILSGIKGLLEMKSQGKTETKNGYTRVVTSEGNTKAKDLIAEFLEPDDQLWRGIGELPGCSLKLKEKFSSIDAEKKHSIPPLSEDSMPEGCACGSVLKGIAAPDRCPLFAGACTPDTPVGPCMVSSEGSCAAFYKYERNAL